MKKSTWIGGILVLAAAVALYGFWASRPVAEVYVAQRGTATSAVYGTVKIVASLTINVRARSSGIAKFSDALAKNPRIGQGVKQGDLLATLINQDLDRELLKAETDLQAAEERKRIGPPSLPQCKTQEAQLERLTKLAQLQNVPVSDLERARNDLQSLRDRVRSEQLELDRSLTILREQAGVLQDRKARTFLTSPLDGYVSAISCVNGEFVNEGSNPFTIATKSTYIEGQVNEEDVGQIQPKMKAAVRLYSFGNREFTATVSQILPTSSEQRYTITLQFDDPPPNLMSGMTGEMNVIAGRREHALIVPARAVVSDRVLVVQDGIVKPRVVKVGFRNLERAEILDGLKEGEQVIVADQDLFRPGQRVRAVTVNL